MCSKSKLAVTVSRYFIGAFLISMSSFSQAQEVDVSEADTKAIVQAVEDATDEATSFAASVAARAEVYSEEALQLRSDVLSKMGEGPTGDVELTDLTSLANLAPSIAQEENKEAKPLGVFAFASFSMPEEALKVLVRDAYEAGVPVVLRGFHGDSLGDTARAMHTLIGNDGSKEGNPELMGGVIIDPRAFRVFDVQQVPTFISTAHPLPDCDGLDCSAPPPPHDRIAGNMTLRGALQMLADNGDAAPLQARAALKKMGDDL